MLEAPGLFYPHFFRGGGGERGIISYISIASNKMNFLFLSLSIIITFWGLLHCREKKLFPFVLKRCGVSLFLDFFFYLIIKGCVGW